MHFIRFIAGTVSIAVLALFSLMILPSRFRNLRGLRWSGGAVEAAGDSSATRLQPLPDVAPRKLIVAQRRGLEGGGKAGRRRRKGKGSREKGKV